MRELARTVIKRGRKTGRLLLLSLLMSGCALWAAADLNNRFGSPHTVERDVALDSEWGRYYQQQVQPVLESRCVVCHGCYDAPCQLKLSSVEGIDRGASKEKVYNGRRLLEAAPSRLGIDAPNTEAWRSRDFYPVLNERTQEPEAHREASVLYRMLELKQQHPLTTNALLPDSVTVGIGREEQCPRLEEFDSFSSTYPQWGMPYGLPGLTSKEQQAITRWLEAGAPLPKAAPLSRALQQQVDSWEAFLNQDSLKGQLVGRYIYEHLFLSHIYFNDAGSGDEAAQQVFRLVRSFTPPGDPVRIVATRRPYDDPGAPIWYRLQLDRATPLTKTRMPYAFNSKRRAQWQQWFFDTEYRVTRLPSYAPDTASNPFKTFRELPVASRYRFMLEEAEYTINGFIKGPVCRGQIALNVIRDRFWVLFVNPDLIDPDESAGFLAEHSDLLVLPAESESNLRPLGNWLNYSEKHKQYMVARSEFVDKQLTTASRQVDTSVIWDGDGQNSNAALTVFRHFDSATVVRGLVGDDPQTTWVISYPVLERIHYLLVAGFDVYGNVSHQLLTRLYMDFLRMESEYQFLALLPRDEQQKQWRHWYRDTDSEVKDFVLRLGDHLSHETAIVYKTDNPKRELYGEVRKRVGAALDNTYTLDNPAVPASQRGWLQKIAGLGYPALSELPQITILSVEDAGGTLHLYTILRDNAHSNIVSLLDESSSRLPEEDRLTVAAGVLGAYPSAFWAISEAQLPELVEDLSLLRSADDYAHFMSRYGVRRTAANFWQHSDRVHQRMRELQSVNYGLLDYNRLENR